jgi:hypothetical protein
MMGDASAGMYSAWKPSVSYLDMYKMMSDLQWIREGKCLRNEDTYDSIVCPVGSLKVLIFKAPGFATIPTIAMCLIDRL